MLLLSHKQKRKRRLIDYSKKGYENPFFKRRRNPTNLPASLTSRIKIISLLVLIAILTLVWFFFYSRFLDIKNIEVRGLNRLSSQEISDLVWRQVNSKIFFLNRQKNIFLFSKDRLRGTLASAYSFEKLTIEKKLPDTIVINIQEKSYAYVWSEADNYYYADIDGYIIEKINPLDIAHKKYPLIFNQGETKIITVNGQEIVQIDSVCINYILSLYNELKPEKYGFEIERFAIDNELNTIRVALYNGPSVYFNILESQEKQINKLLIIKNEKLKDDFNKKSYIDLRYGDRVYYR